MEEELRDFGWALRELEAGRRVMLPGMDWHLQMHPARIQGESGVRYNPASREFIWKVWNDGSQRCPWEGINGMLTSFEWGVYEGP